MTVQQIDPLSLQTELALPSIPMIDRPTLWANTQLLWCLALVPHTVAIIFSVISILKGHGSGNLIDFLGAARDMLAGKDIYSGGTHGYVYPPLIAFLYQPLAMISPRAAGFISLSINAGLSIFTLVLASHVLVHRITGKMDPRLIASVALFGALCTADKIKGEFDHLETNVFMLLAFTAAMRWVDKRPWICGLALGFAFNIKYMPLVLVPFLLFRRRWRAVAWFVVWAIFFAVLPALSMGWKANAAAWGQASGGMLKLFGVHSVVGHAARVRKITDPVSISLTSGLARTTGLSAPWAILIAACTAALFCSAAAMMYAKNQMPLRAWPKVQRQIFQPFRGLMTIEWIGMLLLTLIFSPFTNSRHLYMLMEANLAAGVLLLGANGAMRRTPLVIATIVMVFGISWPPGGIPLFEKAGLVWRGIGGPAWCILFMFMTLIWSNLRYQRAIMKQKNPIQTGLGSNERAKGFEPSTLTLGTSCSTN